MAELKPFRGNYYLWHYVPSLFAAIIFIIIFLLLTIAHAYGMHQKRVWFCSPVVIGGLMEVVGYVGRTMAHNATDKLLPYIIQSIFTLLPPVLFAATIYMILGRIIRAARGEDCSLIRVSRLTKIFVWGDVISFLVQGNGASFMSISSLASMGQWIVIGGLAIQILMFGYFILAAATFQYRYERRSSKSLSLPWTGWKESLYMIYSVSAFIMVRSVFRVLEFVLGTDGYPMSHEWTLYVFDTILIAGVMALLLVYYPDRIPLGSGESGLQLVDSQEALYMPAMGIPEDVPIPLKSARAY
ncbi:RTA1 like protein-domain-containing protein [Pestalotiopsis sp. NC0098]|nr:RTA1 like protein-domain-containing protein [Pestalotiopsis sp. NC0098]